MISSKFPPAHPVSVGGQNASSLSFFVVLVLLATGYHTIDFLFFFFGDQKTPQKKPEVCLQNFRKYSRRQN